MSNLTELKQAMDAANANQKKYRETQGAGYNPYDKEASLAVEAYAEAHHISRIEELVNKFPEVREQWNAAVQQYMTPKGIRARDMLKVEQEIGYTRREVAQAKAIYQEAQK